MEKLIDRIRKLLTLANDAGATEAEAALASNKASALLAEHNLSMSDVELKAEGRENTNFTYQYMWHMHCYVAAAELNMCLALVVKKKGFRKVTYVGRPTAVAVSKLVGDYFVQTIQRMAKEQGGSFAHRKSYAMGVALRVRSRVLALIEERKRSATVSAGGTNLPALANLFDSEMEQNWAASGLKKEMTRPARGRTRFTASTAAGWQDGERVGLDPQVGDANGSAKRLN